jgi:glyoxylase-like metal-dependent hydrolase (beta-lactamase superfamily II)
MAVRAQEVHRVTPALFAWQAYDPSSKVDLTSVAHLVDGRLVMVDPVELAEPAEAELLAAGEPVAIVLTNGNHERASARLAASWQVPVLCHEAAVAGTGIAADACVDDGQALLGGLTVITLPGGGPGELALYHAGTQALSFGDLVINLPGYEFSLLPDKYCLDPQQARASLQRLRGLAISRVTFAHGWPVVTGAGERLAGLLEKIYQEQ